MVRKYGGSTGPKQNPGVTGAPGAWIAGSEVYREKTANLWPTAIAPGDASTTTGSIIFVTSSGVADNAVETGLYTYASGTEISRSTNPTLFGEIGTSFGGGDLVTTFNVPNLRDKFVYVKGLTASGTTAATVHGSGAVGTSHTHSFNIRYTNPSPPRNRSQPNPRRLDGLSTSIASSHDGEGDNCEARASFLIPLVALSDAAMPAGTVFPVLWPNWNQIAPAFPATNYFICSGQAISRSIYPSLYSAQGDLWGNGDGSTTFNVPDLRGLFIKGPRDPAMTQPSGSAAPSGDPSAFATHRHNFQGGSWFSQNGDSCDGPGYVSIGTSPASSTFNSSQSESRPDNMSVMWVIFAG